MSDSITKGREAAERQLHDRVKSAAEALRRGETPKVKNADELDRAEALAREMEKDEARKRLRDLGRGIVAQRRERLAETAEEVDRHRARVQDAVDDVLDSVREEGRADGEYRTDLSMLRFVAEVTGVEFENPPAPGSTAYDIDEAVSGLEARIRKTRREAGPAADPNAPLEALRRKIQGGNPDGAVAQIRSTERRVEDPDTVELLSSEAVEDWVRERAEEHLLGRARGVLAKAARRTGRAILEGRRATAPDTFPPPLTDLLERVRLAPGEWTGHGAPDLDAEISDAVRKVEPAMVVSWARGYEG